MLLCSGCEHRPLVDLNELHYVRIYLDEHIRNVSYGFYDETKEKPEYKTPAVMRVALFEPSSGILVSERYLRDSGTDEKGNYIHGYVSVPAGSYNLLAYNFDTHNIKIKNDRWYMSMEVSSSPVGANVKDNLASMRSGNSTQVEEEILSEPDHFFVANSVDVNLKLTDKIDTLRNLDGSDFVAKSMVKTYYMQVNVKGVEYISSAVAFITGMASSAKLHSGELNNNSSASIYFTMKNDATDMRRNGNVAAAYATFNTFGKLEGVEGYINITFEFNTKWGSVQTETIRVTDMFDTPQVKEKQWIIIDKVIEITPPGGNDSSGGVKPGVNNWDEIQGNITI